MWAWSAKFGNCLDLISLLNFARISKLINNSHTRLPILDTFLAGFYVSNKVNCFANKLIRWFVFEAAQKTRHTYFEHYLKPPLSIVARIMCFLNIIWECHTLTPQHPHLPPPPTHTSVTTPNDVSCFTSVF